jgi:septation ring formation regulator EzrA
MTYYAVLFEQKNFWRVIKTTSQDRAEAVYADFARRSAQLADVDIKRTVLTAQKAYTEELLAKAQARADRLQADLELARKQQALVAGRQKQAREEAASLQTQQLAAQEQLNAMQHQIHLLQRETEQGLPATHSRTHSRHRKG